MVVLQTETSWTAEFETVAEFKGTKLPLTNGGDEFPLWQCLLLGQATTLGCAQVLSSKSAKDTLVDVLLETLQKMTRARNGNYNRDQAAASQARVKSAIAKFSKAKANKDEDKDKTEKKVPARFQFVCDAV